LAGSFIYSPLIYCEQWLSIFTNMKQSLPAMPEPSRNAIWFGAIALAAVGVMLAFGLAKGILHN
jgi:hypothetical protein